MQHETQQGLSNRRRIANISQLVKKDDTWVRIPSYGNGTTPKNVENLHTIEESVTSAGNIRWDVKATQEFCYAVEEVPEGVFSHTSRSLLYPANNSEYDKSTNLRRLVFIEETVHQLYGDALYSYFNHHRVKARVVSFVATEETKSTATLLHILEEIEKFSPNRRSEPIIGIGGGVCLDLVGLAATLFRRRTPYIRVPTTLLALVDASVGAKTGVNFCNAKNKLGAYVPPVAVFLDNTFLKTLPTRHLSNGVGEILKMALVKSPELFELLETWGDKMIEKCFLTSEGAIAIRVAIETMLEELVPNLWEDDLDRLVDFGHVISPLLEMAVIPALLHGEAVTIDMAFMCFLSVEMGLLTKPSLERILSCMTRCGLPVFHPKCTMELIEKSFDGRLKHGNGALRLPMPISIGAARIINEISPDSIRKAAKVYITRFNGVFSTVNNENCFLTSMSANKKIDYDSTDKQPLRKVSQNSKIIVEH